MFYYKFKGIVLIICGKKVSSKIKHLHTFYYMWHAPICWGMFIEVLSSCSCHKLFRLVTYRFWFQLIIKYSCAKFILKVFIIQSRCISTLQLVKHQQRRTFIISTKNELRHDKTNKMACAPSEDSDQPRHPPSLIRDFAVRRTFGSLATHWAHSEDSDQTIQLGRLIWVFAGGTGHFVGFVMLRLKYSCSINVIRMNEWIL